MQGDKTEFISYLSMANAHFIIPVYQRHYAWKIENCKQLYDDILILIKNTNLQHHHFFGSLVSHIDHRGVKVYSYLIDGQQRLTTVSLLLLALYKLNEEGEITFLDNSLIRRLYDTCLFDPYNNRPKLSPIETDRAAFVSLFENSSDLFKTSNFVINYNYFKEQLKKDITQNKFTADEFFNHGICRLDVISIREPLKTLSNCI